MPTLDITALFWAGAGTTFTILVIVVGGLATHKLNLVQVLWYLTYWFTGTGFFLQIYGIYYEVTIFRGEGLIFLVVGAAFLSLAGLVATGASKKQAERSQVKAP